MNCPRERSTDGNAGARIRKNLAFHPCPGFAIRAISTLSNVRWVGYFLLAA
jgi:hypothetical protein